MRDGNRLIVCKAECAPLVDALGEPSSDCVAVFEQFRTTVEDIARDIYDSVGAQAGTVVITSEQLDPRFWGG